MDEPQSFKWVDASPEGDKFQLSVTDLQEDVFDAIGSRPHEVNTNLISIFGKAREGKSFLLNCLADHDGLFRISNRPVPCTHGIDVSNRWMDLKDFSHVDGGTEVTNREGIRVGFVDAEGQGDKAVEHDAHMCCPVLLLSKCVLFNHKGGIQKDDILSKLGIMARAASRVANEVSVSAAQDPPSTAESKNAKDGANESSQEMKASKFKEVTAAQDSLSSTEPSSSKDSFDESNKKMRSYNESFAYRTPSVRRLASKQFGHLHIVLRDWNSDDFDSASIYDTLFATEVGTHSAHDGYEARNQIREEILTAFESVQVWLFPAPNDSGKVLRTEMGKGDMSEEFRDVLREFRAALSTQLEVPKTFAKMPLTGRSIKLLMDRIVDSLNKGSVVVPTGAYKAMLASELNAALREMESDLTSQVTALVESIDKTSQEEVFSESYIITEEEAMKKCDELLATLLKSHDDRIKDTIIDESSEFGRQLLNGSDYGPFVDTSKKLRREYFKASYQSIFSRWCQRANKVAMEKANEKISAIKKQIDIASKPVDEINTELDLVLESMRSIVGLKRYPGNDAIQSMCDNFTVFIKAQLQQVLTYNEDKKVAEEKAAAEKLEQERARKLQEEQERKRQEAEMVGEDGCVCCPR